MNGERRLNTETHFNRHELLTDADGYDAPVLGPRAALWREIRSCARLGSPLALGELGWMSTYIVDALVIGHLPHSALAIAASGLGNTIFSAVAFFAIYMLNGLETIVAQAAGRGDRSECVRIVLQSMWIVLVGTPLVMFLTWAITALLPAFGVERELATETLRYNSVLLWSTAPLMLYMALRRFLQSINRVALISISLVTAGGINLLFDWLLVFGHWHLPRLELVGSGVATIIVRFWMLAILLFASVKACREIGVWPRIAMLRPDGKRIRALLSIGWPSGLQFSTELCISLVITVWSGRLGILMSAAQQVTLDLNAFVYMVPAGLSYAAMIRTGQAAGRNDLPWVKRALNATLLIAMSYCGFASLAFAVFAHPLASLYTNDPHVASAAVPLFWLCVFLIPADALFVVHASALTGLGDTRTPLWVSLVCNWVIGMPLAYLLAFPLGGGVIGLWIGRVIASVTSALALTFMWRRRMRAESSTGRPSLTVAILAPQQAT